MFVRENRGCRLHGLQVQRHRHLRWGYHRVDQTVSGQTLAAATGSFNGDGTGMFSFGIECTTCGNGGSDAFTDDIVFYVANETVADLTQPNNLGNIFVADIINLETGRTGPVDVGNGHVPDSGSTALLLGLGLFGLGFVRMPLRKKPRAHPESVFERATVGWLFCFVHAWNPSI